MRPAMIRSAAFQRPMRALALAAVILLALMPSAARLLASRAGANAQAGWAELCTMAGLKLVKLDAAVPAAPDSGQHGGDCDYCPLLHSLATPATPPAMALARLPPLPAPTLRAPQRLPATPAVGLGSRGPPALS
jgi:hypothetical protein